MSLISNGIDSVRVFDIPAGIWPDGRCTDMPQMALVKWRSVLHDVLYQVYVNGRFAGSTVHETQRQMIVPVPASFTCAVRIEVFAVQPEYADMDLSSELSSTINSGRVKIVLSRSQNMPAGATIQVYSDNGTGQIDYENPISDTAIQVWPNWQDKSGFGMSRFGYADFGYDASAAVGFGKGCFGKNQFGIDADTIEWTSPVLFAGNYKLAVVVFDKSGNKSAAVETETITIIPAAEPAEKLEILSYNKQTNELVLKITD
ncbi:MAG: hypothetical protein JW787_11215 [Sedimentisphaerales bacterium]|nr:hypothetical protein [Sedimentisphaerales bacterium]